MTDPTYSGVLLDRSKPHGKVHGTILTGEAHYHQDGLPFDAHGNLLTIGLTPEQITIAERKAKKAKRLAPKDAPAEGGSAVVPAEDDDDPPGETGDVNLEAWLRGDAKYLFDAVRTAIRTRYTRDCKTTGDAVEFLIVDEKLLPRALVAKSLLPK